MATVIYSPLVSDIRNKIGDVVFSKWKGRGYVRRRVVPANPKSALQIEIREAMALCVASWQSLTSTQEDFWNAAAAERSISPYNEFIRQNVSQERTDDYQVLTPANPDVEPVITFAAATGASGAIDLTWVAGDATPGDDLMFFVRERETPSVLAATPVSALVSALSESITGLDAATDYMVYAYVIDGVSAEASGSVYDNAVSGA